LQAVAEKGGYIQAGHGGFKLLFHEASKVGGWMGRATKTTATKSNGELVEERLGYFSTLQANFLARVHYLYIPHLSSSSLLFLLLFLWLCCFICSISLLRSSFQTIACPLLPPTYITPAAFVQCCGLHFGSALPFTFWSPWHFLFIHHILLIKRMLSAKCWPRASML
jgi:hypothetical protein